MAARFEADCTGNQFMGAVKVQVRGETAFEAACGLANAEWDVANTIDTTFRAASIAKNFTAAAVLLLQEDGRLAVSDPIGRFVDGLPKDWQPATIHQLLTHTSGIPTYTGFPMRQLDRLGATPAQLVATVSDKPLQFGHGTKLAYNNTGYVLLGMLIERASGMKYSDFIHKRLFAPVGMRGSAYDETRTVVRRRATGYLLGASGLENAEQVDASVAWAAGGFRSTVHDLVAWASALMGGAVLKKESTEQMLRIYPETLLQGIHYGYGIVLTERFGKRIFYHGGGITGFTSVLQIYPDEDVIIAVMSNVDSGASRVPSWTVADHLAETLFATR